MSWGGFGGPILRLPQRKHKETVDPVGRTPTTGAAQDDTSDGSQSDPGGLRPVGPVGLEPHRGPLEGSPDLEKPEIRGISSD
jgi:hypothetical protein